MVAPLRTGQRKGALGVILAVLAGLGAPSCSFVVESRDRQCESDEDCAGFGEAVCEAGACVPRESSGTAGCVGPDGCFACEPTTPLEILTACTDVECIPYDNGQLEGLLDPDGSVPDLP